MRTWRGPWDEPGSDGEPWWCWECHGLGGWEEDDADTEYIDCPCCGGDGNHEGEAAPPCHPSRRPASRQPIAASENP